MANFKARHLLAIRQRHPGVEGIGVFVESGTYLGASTMVAHGQFPVVHTIEISEPLYRKALATYGQTPGVHFHLGDSRAHLAALAASIRERVMWYLDAHWFPKTIEPVGGRAEGLPLWHELDALAPRPAGDVVIVDDTHAFGKDVPTPEWRDVTLETIAARLGRVREAVLLGDQAVFYR